MALFGKKNNDCGGASGPPPKKGISLSEDGSEDGMRKFLEERRYAASQNALSATTSTATGAVLGNMASSTTGGTIGGALGTQRHDAAMTQLHDTAMMNQTTYYPPQSGFPWPAEKISNIKNPEDEEMEGLRLEAFRQQREQEFLTWLYTLRMGEWGKFASDYDTYKRVPGGWLVGDDEVFVKFVPREECKVA